MSDDFRTSKEKIIYAFNSPGATYCVAENKWLDGTLVVINVTFEYNYYCVGVINSPSEKYTAYHQDPPYLKMPGKYKNYESDRQTALNKLMEHYPDLVAEIILRNGEIPSSPKVIGRPIQYMLID